MVLVRLDNLGDDLYLSVTLVFFRIDRDVFQKKFAQDFWIRVPVIVIDIQSSTKAIAVVAAGAHDCSWIKERWSERDDCNQEQRKAQYGSSR